MTDQLSSIHYEYETRIQLWPLEPEANSDRRRQLARTTELKCPIACKSALTFWWLHVKQEATKHIYMSELPSPDDIKLIVTDVDGTLLDSHHRLHPRTFHALRWLRDHRPALPIIIATGKQRTSVREIREPLSLEPFHATHLNGCVVYEPYGRVSMELGLDVEVLLQLHAQFSSLSVSLFFYDRENVYELPGHDGLKWGNILRGYGENVQLMSSTLLDRIRNGEVRIIKAAICQGEGLEESRCLLKTDYAPSAFTMTQALPFCIELISSSGSKGNALAKIIGTKIDPKNVVAFGDGENDVSMFQVAGFSVSMENAMLVAKKHATFSTASNDEGGVGIWLEKVYGFEYTERSYDHWL